MIIGNRLKSIRLEKQMSQGDIEDRTGIMRCYISRVENGHTVPSVETLEKLAVALEVPLYQLFYEGNEPPSASALSGRARATRDNWGHSGKWERFLRRIQLLLGRIQEGDRKLLLHLALKMARKNKV
jgi:transcriptional regulator with XRE-family HTH domain